MTYPLCLSFFKELIFTLLSIALFIKTRIFPLNKQNNYTSQKFSKHPL